MYGTFYTSFFILILACQSFVSPFLAKARKSVSKPRAASEALLLHFPGSSPNFAKSEESPIHHFCYMLEQSTKAKFQYSVLFHEKSALQVCSIFPSLNRTFALDLMSLLQSQGCLITAEHALHSVLFSILNNPDKLPAFTKTIVCTTIFP